MLLWRKEVPGNDVFTGRDSTLEADTWETKSQKKQSSLTCRFLRKCLNSLAFIIVGFKNSNQLGDLQQITNALGEVQQFNISTGRAGRRKQADHCADAPAIDIADLGKIQNDAVSGGQPNLFFFPQHASLVAQKKTPPSLHSHN